MKEYKGRVLSLLLAGVVVIGVCAGAGFAKEMKMEKHGDMEMDHMMMDMGHMGKGAAVKPPEVTQGQKAYLVGINGMFCQFCVDMLKKELRDLPLVGEPEVKLETDSAHFSVKEGAALTDAQIKKTVEKAGFTTRYVRLAGRGKVVSDPKTGHTFVIDSANKYQLIDEYTTASTTGKGSHAKSTVLTELIETPGLAAKKIVAVGVLTGGKSKANLPQLFIEGFKVI